MESKKLSLLLIGLIVLSSFSLCIQTVSAQNSFTYLFDGMFEETTLTRVNMGAKVTVVYPAWSNKAPTTFTTTGSGAYTFTTDTQPLYFMYDLSSYYGYNMTRQYWLGTNEISGSYNVYVAFPQLSTINFVIRALGGVQSGTYITATLLSTTNNAVVEQRVIDSTDQAVMNLRPEATYQITMLYPDGSVFSFGNIVASSTVITLTTSPMSFPDEIIWRYQYVRIYADRPQGSTSTIQVAFQDTYGGTISVYYVIYDNMNNIVAEMLYGSVSSFNDVWMDMPNNQSYFLTATIQHTVFGTMTFEQLIGGTSGANAPRLDLSVFGSFYGFPLENIFAVIIILLVFGIFSAMNAWIGAFGGTMIAIFLYWIGWFDIQSTGIFVFAFCVIILIGITFWKRRGG